MPAVSATYDEAPETFRGALDILDVHSGSVIVLRSGEDAETATRFAQQLRKVLYARNIDEVTILVTSDATQLEALDEEMMRSAGWVKAPV